MADDRDIYNLSEPSNKMELWERIAACEGLHRVEIKKLRKGKTRNQLGYLFGVVYVDIRNALYAAWGEKKSIPWVHDAMKELHLRDDIVDPETGECRLGGVGSVAKLDVNGCCEYIDRLIGWAWHELHCAIREANKEWWRMAA